MVISLCFDDNSVWSQAGLSHILQMPHNAWARSLGV